MRSEQVKELLTQHWSLEAEVTLLNGERDLNFKVITADATYIFKLHDKSDKDFIAAQQLLIAAAGNSTSLRSPQIIPTTSGQELIYVGEEKVARLLSWIEGSLWSSVQEPSAELLSSLGRAVANLDVQLRTVDTSATSSVFSKPFGWNVMQTANLLDKTHLIRHDELRETVEQVLDHAVREVLPALAKLPTQVIHNDGNDNNIIVANDRVIGLIDFGDAIIAPRICGLAVACAYVIDNSDDPMRNAIEVVRGYHQETPLNATEIELLEKLITLRVATSITMAAIQSQANPENEYLNISQALFGQLLPRLATNPNNLTWFRFRNACGFEANPNSRKVREWLMSNNAPRADVVLPPLGEAKKIWLDWSGDNPEIAREWEQIAALMHAEHAVLAIGHYCENREVYSGEAFDVSSPNRRSVHLGVDLFAPAGTPVHAAHDGVVHLFNDNNVYLDYGPVIVLQHETGDGIAFWTLYGHLSRPSLEGLYHGKPIKAGEQIATMGEEHENVGWPPHTHFQLLTDLCGMGLDVYGVAPLLELPVWRSISPNPNLLLQIAEGTDAHTHLRQKTIANERNVVMSRALSLNYTEPLEIVRGDGAYLFDREGRSYLDLVNNVAHVGHCNPRVVSAGANQMATLNTNTRYLNQNVVEFARALASTMPDPLNVVFFVNSGSEANDLALRLAQTHTKAKGMLVLDHAYHGHLSSIIDISPYKFNRKGGNGAPNHVRVVPLPDSYKGVHRGPDAGVKYAAELVAQLGTLDEPLCAFISESIVSTAGQVTLCDGFLPLAYEQVRAAGGVCIADEVQIGMGRVGTHFWGFELHGVVPDIVTIGKPLGNGHPLAAVVTTPEIAASFLNGMEYFNTFGGNPVSAAIGQAVLDVVTDRGLTGHAVKMGNFLMDRVRELANDIEFIGDVRGSGLFLGVELVLDRESQTPATAITANLMEFAKSRGVFLSCDGPANNVLKIKPPMVVEEPDIELFLSVFAAGLRAQL